MRVNIYAEEMTDRIEIFGKEVDGQVFTGLRFYLELPVTVNGAQVSGPFVHRPGDDDSAAVTFWGKRDLRAMLERARVELDAYYQTTPPDLDEAEVERVAARIAASDGCAFHEVCGFDAPGCDDCESETCVAAGFEDHDAESARRTYRRYARAAIKELRGIA